MWESVRACPEQSEGPILRRVPRRGNQRIRLCAFAVLFVSLLWTGAITSGAYAQMQTHSTPATNSPSTCPSNYDIVLRSNATPVAGTSLVSGSQCDDCSFVIALPFAYTLYNQSFNSINGSSNG